MTYRTLEDWLNDQEGYAVRAERIPPGAYPWIAEAWKLGTLAAQQDAGAADRLSGFKELADRLLWHPIETAPKEGFILLYCAEDASRWLAAWQGYRWYGVDDLGLTREGSSAGDPNVVTGWFVDAWMPLPDGPHRTAVEQSPTTR